MSRSTEVSRVAIAYKGSFEKLLQLLTDIEDLAPARRGA